MSAESNKNVTQSVGWTRREFVATATVAGLAAAVTPSLARTMRRDATPLKVGLVGCGGRGTGAAVNALNADEHAVMWAVGDLFEERIGPCGTRIAEAIGPERAARQIAVDDARLFSGFNAYRKVIDSGVDVVLLCTPPAFRPQ